jgi:hypothetical protein
MQEPVQDGRIHIEKMNGPLLLGGLVMKLIHRFAELAPEKRPQDRHVDGTGLRFETMEHGGEYPDTIAVGGGLRSSAKATHAFVPEIRPLPCKVRPASLCTASVTARSASFALAEHAARSFSYRSRPQMPA